MMQIKQGSIRANGIDFTYLSAGPERGPLALCLHGFPDSPHTWRPLLTNLAEAGYRAVAPFMRGYAPTSVPADGVYQGGALAADANALHAAFGAHSNAVLIGHDWGAAATYGAAASAPQRWRKVVAMAAPPAAAMGEEFFGYEQLKRSFYVYLFQTPLAEAALNRAFIEGLWRDWSPSEHPDYSAAIAQGMLCLAAPQNAKAAISYYRALFDDSQHHERYATEQNAITERGRIPVLYLHGAQDGCLSADVIAPHGDLHRIVAALPPGSHAELVPNAGHFLQLDRCDEVNTRILAWLAA